MCCTLLFQAVVVFLVSKFSFASSMSTFHSFSETMVGHSCLMSRLNLSLYWSLAYFKFSSVNFATTFLLNVFPNKFIMWYINTSLFSLSWLFHRVRMVGPNRSNALSFKFLQKTLFPAETCNPLIYNNFSVCPFQFRD